MTDRALFLNGVRVPRLLYGTAWKEEQTQRLTALAIEHGFRGIDTANQRRHYHEAAVGLAVSSAIASGLVTRDDVFLQTKFTFMRGQDHRLPYEPAAEIATQVEQSFASSLEHLRTATIDAYLLHGPTHSNGLATADWDAWRAMEVIHDSGRVRLLGVSNVTLEQLDGLCQKARIRPRFVQNRCYAVKKWDREVRTFCVVNGITYQGFSLLTANRQVIGSPELQRIAKRHDRTVEQVIFRFALDIGMVPLTGTTDGKHMRADLDVFDFQLNADVIEEIEGVGKRLKPSRMLEWEESMSNVRKRARPLKVLFIGNSFTARNDLPGMISNLATARGTKIEHRLISAGGASLRTHWNAGEALKAIQTGRYDFVVLQEQSTLPIKNATRMHENVRLFDQAIKSADASTVLYMTWARKHSPDTQSVISDAYKRIGRELGAMVIPVGDVWKRFLGKHARPELYDRDGSHPTLAGSYLAACVFLAVLVEQDPVGISEAFTGLSDADRLVLQKEGRRAMR